MKFIRNVQFHLAVTACVSMVMSPLAMAKETKNLAMVHKKRLEEFQFSKKQTYGEYWKKVRKEYEPKVREKLDHWAFAMRNEKMPDVSYSTFVDRDGTEKLRIHLSKNGKTDTLTIHATDEKALAFNNVNISPEEAASIDTMVMKVMAEDEKKGREMLSAPSFAERRPSSSPPTLNADEFFALSAKERSRYLKDFADVLESVESLQNTQYQIKEVMEMEAPKEKKSGAFFDFLNWTLKPSASFAGEDDPLKDLEAEEKANKKTRKTRKTSKTTAVDFDKLASDCGNDGINCEKYETALRDYKKTYGEDDTYKAQAAWYAPRKVQREQAEKAQKEEAVKVQAATDGVGVDELFGSASGGKANCFAGAVVGEMTKNGNSYYCKQSSALNNTMLNSGVKKSFQNECKNSQAFCSPLLYGVSENKYRCVEVGDGKGKPKKSNITELCNQQVDKVIGTNSVLYSIFGGEFSDSSSCLEDPLCYAKSKKMFDSWKMQFDGFVDDYVKICTETSPYINRTSNYNLLNNPIEVSDKYYNIDAKKTMAIQKIREDQKSTCEQLQKRLKVLNAYQFPDAIQNPPAEVTSCDGFGVVANNTSGTTAGAVVDSKKGKMYCKCTTGYNIDRVYELKDASVFCKVDFNTKENPVSDIEKTGFREKACEAANKPGTWEKRLNSFWTKREKYKVATEQCAYSWSEKAAPLGLFTGIGVVLGLGSKAKDAIEKRKEKAATTPAAK